ncbi:FMN-linked oxidoreductase [Peniophora sp. CONT]|nr:FMN-linked oxidoreductase [Peniophora sp. CONT]
MSAVPKLFQPLRVGASNLKHRVVMAPMTRNRATDTHVPTPLMAEYYAQRASTPGTLLITEATFIAEKATGQRKAPGIWSEEQVEAWKKITDAVHEKGSSIYLQLWALGRAAYPKILKEKNLEYVAADAIGLQDRESAPRALTVSEIQEYVELFGAAAHNAIKAGCDGVEIHGANGYLLDQFLQDVSNKRSDNYGGSIENRIRFTDEVVDAVVSSVGATRSAIRLSPWSTYQEMGMANPIPTFEALVKRLDSKHPDLSYIHLMDPMGPPPSNQSSVERSNDSIANIRLPRPVIFNTGYERETAIKKAETDGALVAFGRPFLANPDLPVKLEKDLELNQPDYANLYFGPEGHPEVGYTDYKSASA